MEKMNRKQTALRKGAALLLMLALLMALAGCAQQAPTPEPTAAPTAEPTAAPTAEPTAAPTAEPTAAPTDEPTAAPTDEPTAAPTDEPTAAPTDEPTAAPTANPTAEPVAAATSEKADSALNDTVVATVNGENILYQDVIDQVRREKETYAMYMAMYGQSVDPYDASFQQYIAESILTDLTMQKVLDAKATELGLAVTDEKKQEIEASTKAQYDEAMTQCMAEMKTQNPDASEDEIKKLAEEELAFYQYTEAELLKYNLGSALQEQLYNYAIKDVAVTEADARAAYMAEVDEAKARYAESKDNYVQDFFGDVEIRYTPAGMRYVQHILLTVAEGQTQEEVVARANEILAEIQAGKDYDAALQEYSEDTGKTEPMMANGYPIFEGSQAYTEKFTAAAMALANVGDISPVVESEFGVHILRYKADIPEAEVPFEQDQEHYTADLLELRKQEAFESATNQWMDAAGVQVFPDVLIEKEPEAQPVAEVTYFGQVKAETALKDMPNSTTLATLQPGVGLTVQGQMTVADAVWGYVQVNDENGLYGYVAMGDVELVNDLPATPAGAVTLATVDATGKLPVFTIAMNDGALIYGELYPETAPQSVGNFAALANHGDYTGTIFHRVIPGFMIQGGDPKGDGTGGPDYTIKGEFSGNGVENPQKHERGVLSMARSSLMDSAGSQFFICVADATQLDGQYAAFGKVLGGMETVDAIVNTPTNANNRPTQVMQQMKLVHVETYGQEYAFEKLPQ